MSTDLPNPQMATLLAYRDLTSDLHQWAPTAHRLVCERIDALAAAYGSYNHPLETSREHAERVLAHGQHPFPQGSSVYDDLNVNSGYDHIEVGYGTLDDGGARITFTGSYPKWAADGESYERHTVTIHCPAWVVTSTDGPQRFRIQTDEMVAAVKEARRREDEAIVAAIEADVARAKGE